MRKRHSTQYAGIYYRLVKEDRPDGPRRYIVGYTDANGRWHTETLPVGMNLEDARLRKAALETKKNVFVPTHMTIGDLLDLYLYQRKNDFSTKTYNDYAYGRDVVKDFMGNRKVRELTANDCAALIAKLKKDGKKAWTIRKILTPLNGALKIAIREGWLQGNPMDALLTHERPKADQKEMRCLSSDEIPRLLAAASSERWRLLFATLTFCGLRVGEALALKWTDVDLHTGTVFVRGEKDGARKTAAAKRDVMMIPALVHPMRAYKIAQGQRGYVFANGNGLPVSRREALRALRAAEKRAGLPEYTLHELRHTFASILIAQGEPVTLVARQMGHKDPSVTLKTYAHLFDEAENVQLAKDRLQAACGGMV